MSEQLTETSHIPESDEPSMEDILASIRRIISDDEVSDADMLVENALEVEAPALAADAEKQVSEAPIVDLVPKADTDFDMDVQSLLDLEREDTLNVVDAKEAPQDSENLAEETDLSMDIEALSLEDLDFETDDFENLIIPETETATELDSPLSFAEADIAASKAVIDKDTPISAADFHAEIDLALDEEIDLAAFVDDDTKSPEDITSAAEPMGIGSALNQTETDGFDSDDADIQAVLNELGIEAPMTPPQSNISEVAPSADHHPTAHVKSNRSLSDLVASVPSSTPDTPVEETKPVLQVTEELTVSKTSEMDLVKSLLADLTDTDLDDAIELDGVHTDTGSYNDDMPDLVFEAVEDAPDAALSAAKPAPGIIELPSHAEDKIETQPETGVSALMAIAELANSDAEAMESKAFNLGAHIEPEPNEEILEVESVFEADDDIHISDNLADLIESDSQESVDLEIPMPAPEVLDETLTIDTEDLAIEPSHIETKESDAMPAKALRAVTEDTILDDVTETATADAFASLNKVVEQKAIVAERGDRIGDLVQEALRPMLKDWLDANLKGIVERAVAKEVKRISSGK